jgi:hypothetical protein
MSDHRDGRDLDRLRLARKRDAPRLLWADGSSPRFQPIGRFRPRKHREDQIAISASDFGESELAHLRELLADGRRQVLFHPLERCIEITLADLQFARV